MLIPLLILSAALAAAGVTAYGTDPHWAVYSHGLAFIMLSRRIQWLLISIVIGAVATALAMIVGGRWRAWWLIGLAPILALFVHRFAIDPARAMAVDANAEFVAADQVRLSDNEYVVGVSLDGESFAYPYRILYQTPVVVRARPQRRLVLIWSAYANRAVATTMDWNLEPRDLEIVSVPANSLLVYNSEIGQFINGVTGLTPDGRRPSGFGSPIATVKTTWKNWLHAHPETQVLEPMYGCSGNGPTVPIMPRYPMPDPAQPLEQVAFVDSGQPAAIRENQIGSAPLNLTVGHSPMLVFRDGSGAVRAFLRVADGDLVPRFIPVSMTKNMPAGGLFTEHDSDGIWTADGRDVAGKLKGQKLQPVDVDEEAYLPVLKYWFPNLLTITPQPSDIGKLPPAAVVRAKHVQRKRHPRRAVVIAAS